MIEPAHTCAACDYYRAARWEELDVNIWGCLKGRKSVTALERPHLPTSHGKKCRYWKGDKAREILNSKS